MTEYEVIADEQYVWRGRIEGDAGGVVSFSIVNDRLVGDIVTSRGRMFSIRFVEEGIGLVEELDPAKFPREEGVGEVELYHLPGRPLALRVDESGFVIERLEDVPSAPLTAEIVDIDVMVLYTVAAADFAIGEDAVTAKINQAISDTNKSYEDSEVRQRIRLAHVEQTEYQEKASNGADWRALRDSSDNEHLAGLDGLRITHEADIVVLINKPTDEIASCGSAKQMVDVSESFCTSAFAVVPINCATSVHSFAHELGHLMGADHNNGGDTSGAPIKHNRGYVAPSNAWRTIMAYATETCVLPECQRILHWSNPSVSYDELAVAAQQTSQPEQASQSEPTGSDDASDPANNALTLNETANTVVKFSDECAAQTGPSA